MNYIFTFRSRTNAIRFYDALKNENIAASLINTPKAAGIGCGLSVKLSDYDAAKKVLSLGFSNFHAVFKIETENGFIRLVKM